MLEKTKSLVRILVAFIIVLGIMSIIYPEGFSAIADAITQNFQILLFLILLWFILSVIRKKGEK